MIDVCLPGTGGMMPLSNRCLCCCWIAYQGQALLIDCGEGTQVALQKAGCKLSRLSVLLITHFHADHIAGLPGLLLTLGNCGKRTPLTIVGPAGLQKVVSALCVIAPELPYPSVLVEWDENPKELFAQGFTVAALPLFHGVPCFGYRVTFERPPAFNPQKAEALAIPKRFYRTLHAGQPVTLGDGRLIRPDMVLCGVRAPIRICYVTDTQPNDALVPFVHGADMLICEGMHADESKRDSIHKRGHMLFCDSAELAKKAEVGRLWLTHFSPALSDPQSHLSEAEKIFPRVEAAYDGIHITLAAESHS